MTSPTSQPRTYSTRQATREAMAESKESSNGMENAEGGGKMGGANGQTTRASTDSQYEGGSSSDVEHQIRGSLNRTRSLGVSPEAVDPFNVPVRNDPYGHYAQAYDAGNRNINNAIASARNAGQNNASRGGNSIDFGSSAPSFQSRRAYMNDDTESDESDIPLSRVARRNSGRGGISDLDSEMDFERNTSRASTIRAGLQSVGFGRLNREDTVSSGPSTSTRRALSIPFEEDDDQDSNPFKKPAVRGRYIPGAKKNDSQNGSGLFVNSDNSNGSMPGLEPDNTHNRVNKSGVRRAKYPSEETQARYEHNSKSGLAPSRFSGIKMPWGLNKIQAEEENDDEGEAPTRRSASLIKHENTARGRKKTKRSYGANDPENLAIVNMRDNDNMSFDAIASYLNSERTKDGKIPNLTISGVNGRYNRTAPLICAAEGREFVSAAQRRKGIVPGQSQNELGDVWNEQLDLELVNRVKEYDSNKWNAIAATMEQITGEIFNPKQCATRYTML